MNREILFRGKRIDNGEWIYGYYTESYDSPAIDYLIDDDGWICDIEVYPSTVGQYTGLINKNGVKIFEGDIVSIPFEEDRSPYEENCIYYENAVVYFDTKRYGWYVKLSDEDELSLWEYDETDIEVIGNVHDNSEKEN